MNKSAEYMGSGDKVSKLVPLTEGTHDEAVQGNSSMERLISGSPGRGPSQSVEPTESAVLPK
jgi:hypothetical protein